VQLLRIRLPQESGLVPEVSGNRLMLSVRLMRMVDDARLQLMPKDISFDLTLCA
jgi:cell division protein ZapD